MISINNMFKFISQKLSGLLGIKNVKKWKMIDEKMNTNNNLYNAYHKCISKIMDIGLNNITSIQKISKYFAVGIAEKLPILV